MRPDGGLTQYLAFPPTFSSRDIGLSKKCQQARCGLLPLGLYSGIAVCSLRCWTVVIISNQQAPGSFAVGFVGQAVQRETQLASVELAWEGRGGLSFQ